MYSNNISICLIKFTLLLHNNEKFENTDRESVVLIYLTILRIDHTLKSKFTQKEKKVKLSWEGINVYFMKGYFVEIKKILSPYC